MKIAKYRRSAGAFILAALPDQRVKLTVIIGLEFAPESNLCNFTLILTVRGAKRGKYVLNYVEV